MYTSMVVCYFPHLLGKEALFKWCSSYIGGGGSNDPFLHPNTVPFLMVVHRSFFFLNCEPFGDRGEAWSRCKFRFITCWFQENSPDLSPSHYWATYISITFIYVDFYSTYLYMLIFVCGGWLADWMVGWLPQFHTCQINLLRYKCGF